MNIITTRADLDALQGTPAHAQFMAMLAGSLYRLEKDDEAKAWKAVEDDAMIQRFGFVRADFPNAAAPTLPVYVPEPVEEVDPKLTGIEFDGVMCSATSADAAGLLQVKAGIEMMGTSFKTKFLFANGTALVITAANFKAFMQAWVPFRQSFFAPDE
jgi:hypothetical protein